MTLDASAKNSNVRLSVKKYLIDTLETEHGGKVFFGLGYSLPDLVSLTEWVSVGYGQMNQVGLSHLMLDLIAATRKDAEGDRLAELVDICFDIMTDNTQQDGKRRIALFDTSDQPWTEIDKMIVTDVNISGEMTGPDNTKYHALTCTIKWVAKA